MQSTLSPSIYEGAGEFRYRDECRGAEVALTPVGEALKSATPGAARSAVLMTAGPLAWKCFEQLQYSVLGAEVDIIAYITSRHFCLLDFGKVYSSALAAFALAGTPGPLVMGTGFDRTGSYHDPLILFFVAAAIAAALMTRLGPYRSGSQQTVPT